MRFYRLHFHKEGGNSDGYEWFTSLAPAKRAKREQDSAVDPDDACDEVEVVDVTPTKDGILFALREFGSHANNG